MRILKPIGRYKGFRIVDDYYLTVFELAWNRRRIIIDYTRRKQRTKIHQTIDDNVVKRFGMKWKQVKVQ